MSFLISLCKLFSNIIRIPVFFAIHLYDKFIFYKKKRYKEFDRWGIHIFTSKFGAGKTSSMVYTAYKLCKQFHQVQILTNITLSGFPNWTVLLPLCVRLLAQPLDARRPRARHCHCGGRCHCGG